MWYGLMIWVVLGFAGDGLTTILRAETQRSQQIRLVGHVIDQARRPVEGVEVIVNRREVRGMTDSLGFFQLDVVSSDSTVGFRRIGYRPMLFTIRPLPSTRDTIRVELVSSPVQLPEVIVSASPGKPLRYAGTTKYDEVFLRRKVGLGTLIPRDVIDTRFGVATHELLQGIPGVRIWNGPPKRIRFARCQEPSGVAFFIDGMRQVPNRVSTDGPQAGASPGGLIMQPRPKQAPGLTEDEPAIEVLSRVNPSDIEMIEVFRGPSEIPAVFHWDGCAVVAIWTRWDR